MKFYMHQRIIGENLIKIGLILSAQWRFSEERYQACPVTLKYQISYKICFEITNVTLFGSVVICLYHCSDVHYSITGKDGN